jgi:hypothetical protein
MAMNIRKIAVVGSFAAGAALALAPIASADPDPAAVDPLAPFVASEVSSANGLFQLDALLTGVPSTDYSVGPQGFDFIKLADVPAVQDNGTTPFDFAIYGVNPTEAGLATDPGAANLFNGALVNFYDAYNVELYQLFNPGVDPSTIPVTDLFGSDAAIAEALGTSAAMGGPVTDFLTDGWNDLLGYFGIFAAGL